MPHNERFPAQWELITNHINFAGKYVLDLGCGYGDLVAECWIAGAERAVGLDSDPNVVRIARDHLMGRYLPFGWVQQADITKIDEWGKIGWDIIVCFSVLPYIEDKDSLLEWIKSHCETALFEIQTKGDGPGTLTLREIKQMLEQRWHTVESIGATYVTYREKARHIWICR